MNRLSELLTANIPKYDIIIPSTGEKTKFRPFLVKEEKVLLVAQNTGSTTEVLNSIQRIIEHCVDDIQDVSSLPLFDLEYLFVKLRSKSIGELANPIIKCPVTEEEIQLEVNLNDIELKGTPKKENKIKISENIILKMKYPTLKTILDQDYEIDFQDPESFYNLAIRCIEEIITKEENINVSQLPIKEIEEFVDNMTKNQFEKILNFFVDIPKLEKSIKYVTSDGVQREVLLSGLSDFFG